MLNSSFNFIAIFIYAPARREFKQEFWADFMLYASSILQPFVIIGDFNEIGSYLDKLGGADFSHSRLSVLNQLHSQISVLISPFLVLDLLGGKRRLIITIFLND